MNCVLKWTSFYNALPLLVLLLIQSKTVLGLSCYVCDSQQDSGCEGPVDPQYKRDCIDDHYKAVNTRCLKTIQQLDRPTPAGSYVRIVRRCGWAGWSTLDEETSCRTEQNLNGEEKTCICKDNFCNGSSHFTANHMIIIAFTLVSFLLCFSLSTL